MRWISELWTNGTVCKLKKSQILSKGSSPNFTLNLSEFKQIE